MAKLQQVEESVLEELAGFLDYREQYEENIVHENGEFKLFNCKMPNGVASEAFRVPAGINIITRNAFYRAKYSSIILPSSINLVKEEAVSSMKNLESLRLPAGVTIKKKAIHKCKSLKSIYISPNSKVGRKFIKGCSALEEIIVEGYIDFDAKAFKYIPDNTRIIALDEAAKESILSKHAQLASRVVVAGKSAKAHTSGINIRGYSDDMSCFNYAGVRALLSENKRANNFYHKVAEIYGEADDAAIEAVHDHLSKDRLEVYLSKESSMLEMSEALLALQTSPRISLWSYGQEEDLAILDVLALYGDHLEKYQLNKTIVLTLSDGVTRVIPLKELKGELEELEDYRYALDEGKTLNTLDELDESLAQEKLEEVEDVPDLPMSSTGSEVLSNEAEQDKTKNDFFAAAWAMTTNFAQSVFPSKFNIKPEEDLPRNLVNTKPNSHDATIIVPPQVQGQKIEPDAVTIVCGGDAPNVKEDSSSKQAELPEAHYKIYDAIRALYSNSEACRKYVDKAIAGEASVESKQQYVHGQYDQVKRAMYLESKHCKSAEFCEAFLIFNNPKSIKIVSHGESEDKALIDALLLYQRYANDAKLNMTHRVQVTFSDKAQIDLTLKNLDQLKDLSQFRSLKL